MSHRIIVLVVGCMLVAVHGEPTRRESRLSDRAASRQASRTAVRRAEATAYQTRPAQDSSTKPQRDWTREASSRTKALVAGPATYGRLPRGDLPIMPPVVVDYRNDLPSRLRAEGKLEGPLPLRAQIVEDGPNGLAIAAIYPCGSGCTWDIECADGDPCTTDNCAFEPG